MRRLLICAVIGTACWYVLHTLDLPQTVYELVPQAQGYADAILLGAYTILIILVAPTITVKPAKVEVKPTPAQKVDFNLASIDPTQLAQLVGKLNIKDPNNSLPGIVERFLDLKKALATLREITDNNDLFELTEKAESLEGFASALQKLTSLEVPNLNGELKELSKSLNEVYELGEEHNLEDRSNELDSIIELKEKLDRLAN